MPVPTASNTPTKPPAPSNPTQKSMTKAERRELQERQRAAKLQKQTAGSTTATAVPSPSKSKPPPTPSQKKIFGDSAGSSGGTKAVMQRDANVGSAGIDDGTGLAHGLRIFTHFGLPKPFGHAMKGDIHPAIIRLGLLFSEFRICGANARCIATLTAFKNVCPFGAVDGTGLM
jgi:translation initiation factor eIF-2B subunit delta